MHDQEIVSLLTIFLENNDGKDLNSLSCPERRRIAFVRNFFVLSFLRVMYFDLMSTLTVSPGVLQMRLLHADRPNRLEH